MKKWSPRRIIALFLGLWVALAPAVFAIPAAAMTAQTSMAEDAGTGGCDGCPEGYMERGLCALICLNAGHLAVTVESGTLIADFSDDHELGRCWAILGYLPTSDPPPPKPVSFL